MHSIKHQEYPITWTLNQITADVNFLGRHSNVN